MKQILTALEASKAEFIDIRHFLHENPEVGFETVIAADLVAEKLASWGYSVHRGLAQNGVVGTLKVGNSNKTIGLRADMDALPIQEKEGRAWGSKIANTFHGCGHDGHTAILLCAAKYLAENRNFDGTLHVIFQPAEELLYGGKVMVEDGLFDLFPCDAIFGLHNMPGYKTGEFYLRKGAQMASSDTLHIHITGKGAHGAMPERGIDATVVACYIGTALQTIISRNVTPFEPAVVTIGCIESGDAPNVVNGKALMKLSMRALSNEVRQTLLTRVNEIAASIAESMGATAEVEHINGSPVVINDGEMTDFSAKIARKLVGEDKVHLDAPAMMASDDFAFMIEKNPKASYVFFGNGDEVGYCNVHNSGYDFNDDALVPAAAYWVAITEQFLV